MILSQKQHGMLFKAAMIVAILEGRKTQTRRPITFHDSVTTPHVRRDEWHELRWDEAVIGEEVREGDLVNLIPLWRVPFRDITVKVYPRIMPGDLIWAKECWRFLGTDMNRLGRNRPEQDGVFMYRADKQRRTITRPWRDIEKYMVGHSKWRSSMLMPRWASRLDLPVGSTRSQRVQEISEGDARREGVSLLCSSENKGMICVTGKHSAIDYVKSRQKNETHHDVLERAYAYIPHFAALWDSINVDRGFAWADNHPVWIYDFKVKK